MAWGILTRILLPMVCRLKIVRSVGEWEKIIVPEKRLLFSITKNDLEMQTFRSGGKGGQNQNKRDTGVRLIHRASGAVGEARDSRTQEENRKNAFLRLTKDPRLKAWIQKEAWKHMGILKTIEQKVEAAMQDANLKIEYLAL